MHSNPRAFCQQTTLAIMQSVVLMQTFFSGSLVPTPGHTGLFHENVIRHSGKPGHFCMDASAIIIPNELPR